MSEHHDGNDLPEVIKDVISTLDGIPLPAEVKKSFWKSISKLLTGAVDVPVAWLESKAEIIRATTEGKKVFIKRAGEVAAEGITADTNLTKRAIDHFANRVLQEQSNREAVVEQVVDELKNDPPSEDSQKSISDDWLTAFARIAEQKSERDIQLFLAKIMAGEIRSPGTFSLRTISLISMLDQATAQLFQRFCDISCSLPPSMDAFLLTEHVGSAGQNALAKYGLNYVQLMALQDAGLIQSDLNSSVQYNPVVFAMSFSIGGKQFPPVQVQLSDYITKHPNMIRMKAVHFTKSGLEIRKVLHLGRNEQFEADFIAWVGRLDIKLSQQ